MRYQHRRGNTCDFTIMIPGLVAFVMVKRLDRLTCLPEDIVHDFSGAISLLRFIASTPGISRELWLYTPHGAWRFFRVLDDRIVELDRDGKPIENSCPGSAVLPVPEERAGKTAEAVAESGKKSGKGGRSRAGRNPVPDAIPVEDPAPEKDPEPTTIPEKNSEPAKEPGLKEDTDPVKDTAGPVPDSLSEKNPEPEKDLVPLTIPEKFVILVQDPGPAEDPPELPEPEEIPAIIKKFLKRRSKGLDKDPGSE
jgi:hypothetical protein